MISDDFDISGFSLKEDEFVPTTGIKINLNVKDSIEINRHLDLWMQQHQKTQT